MATLILHLDVCTHVCVCVRARCSSKRSCESAGSLGKVNLAVAAGSKLITARELWSVSERGVGRYLAFWKHLFGLGLNIPIMAKSLFRSGQCDIVVG